VDIPLYYVSKGSATQVSQCILLALGHLQTRNLMLYMV